MPNFYPCIHGTALYFQNLSVIMSGPRTQVVAPGATVTFNCHARGNYVYWHVNGTDPFPESDYETIGFTFSYVEIPRPSNELEEHSNTITVEARPSNNNTRISCTASGWITHQHAFQVGTLIIAGISSTGYAAPSLISCKHLGLL